MPSYIKVGEHYICELSGCDRALLLDNDQIHERFIKHLPRYNLSVIDQCEFTFNPHGYTCLVLLAESHASLHVWPEHGYCAIDLFTCSFGTSLRPFFLALQKAFQASHISIQMIERRAVLPFHS